MWVSMQTGKKCTVNRYESGSRINNIIKNEKLSKIKSIYLYLLMTQNANEGGC